MLGNGVLDPRGLFSVYRKDRLDGYGGVCPFILNSIQSSPIAIDFNNFCNKELVDCNIIYWGPSISLFCYYCAPSLSSDLFKLSLDCFRSACDLEATNLIFGDFNIPSIDWSITSRPSLPKPIEFLKLCSEFGLTQVVNSPTRGDNYLDLVLINDPVIISSIVVGPPVSTSDHNSICISIVTPPAKRIGAATGGNPSC